MELMSIELRVQVVHSYHGCCINAKRPCRPKNIAQPNHFCQFIGRTLSERLNLPPIVKPALQLGIPTVRCGRRTPSRLGSFSLLCQSLLSSSSESARYNYTERCFVGTFLFPVSIFGLRSSNPLQGSTSPSYTSHRTFRPGSDSIRRIVTHSRGQKFHNKGARMEVCQSHRLSLFPSQGSQAPSVRSPTRSSSPTGAIRW